MPVEELGSLGLFLDIIYFWLSIATYNTMLIIEKNFIRYCISVSL